MQIHTPPEMEQMRIGVSLLENLLGKVIIFNHFLGSSVCFWEERLKYKYYSKQLKSGH